MANLGNNSDNYREKYTLVSLNLENGKYFPLVELHRGCFKSEDEIENIYQDLENNNVMNWKQYSVKPYNVDYYIPQPRKSTGFSKDGKGYTYSWSTIPGIPYDKSETISHLHSMVKTLFDVDCSYFLCNRYEIGDYIGKHADSEYNLDTDYPIVSLSFGQSRIFRITPYEGKYDPDIFKFYTNLPELELTYYDGPRTKTRNLEDSIKFSYDIKLKSGDILLMRNPVQQYCKHEITKFSKRKLVVQENYSSRINLTGRVLKNFKFT